MTGMREPIRLHLGGRERRDGWTIVNIAPGPNVDIVGDVANLSAFRHASIAEVYASHVFEHLSMNQIAPALQGVFRVLEPDGLFRIAVPNLETLARLVLDTNVSTSGLWELTRRIYGGDTDQHDRHGCGFVPETLQAMLEQVGFADIRQVESFGLFLDSSEATFLGYRISLNIEARKP